MELAWATWSMACQVGLQHKTLVLRQSKQSENKFLTIKILRKTWKQTEKHTSYLLETNKQTIKRTHEQWSFPWKIPLTTSGDAAGTQHRCSSN